jgi:aspartate racemase
LVAAGAECVVVTSIAGHFCINEFKAVSPLPVVDLIVEVCAAVEKRGLKIHPQPHDIAMNMILTERS